MTHAPSVSVIIPVYQVTSYLDQAITSVTAQDYEDVRIIIVDDGSDTEAAETITQICARHPEVILIRQKNTGQGLARLAGIKATTGDFVMFLDADDMLLPGAITHLVQTLQDHPDAVASYGRKATIDEDGEFVPRQILPYHRQAASGNILPALLKGAPILTPGNICIRRRAIKDSMFPENMRQGEDWVTWCRLALAGNIIYAGRRVVMCWREHRANTSASIIKNASPLFAMLDMVCHDPAIVSRVGLMQLAVYRMWHERNIRRYLAYQNRDAGFLRNIHHRLAGQRMPAIARTKKIRVLHVVKYFYAGGAERLVSSVLSHSDKDVYEHIILSLSDQGERLAKIEQLQNIPYIVLPMHKGNYVRTFISCLHFVHAVRPHLIKTWLPPANVTGGIIGKLLGIPVVWGIHDAQPPATQPPITRVQTRLRHWLPNRVVCCSTPAFEACIKAGYPESLLQVIENGIDADYFRYTDEGRKRVRAELGIADGPLLIGMAAECTAVKRHGYFLAAAKYFLAAYPDTRFLLCGQYTDTNNEKLMDVIKLYELEQHVHVLGVRDDMPDIYSALDIHTLTSRSESFGLAIAEAVACKTPSVATDTGMIGKLLDHVGVTIPVTEDAHVLVQSWETLLAWPENDKRVRLEAGRKRIMEQFSIRTAALEYDNLFRRMV